MAVKRKASAKKKAGATKSAALKKKAGGKKRAVVKKKKAAGKKKAAPKKKATKGKLTKKKAGRRKAAVPKSRKAMTKSDKTTIRLIDQSAATVHETIKKSKKPDLLFPVRSLGNVSYSKKKGYFEIGKQKKEVTLMVKKMTTLTE